MKHGGVVTLLFFAIVAALVMTHAKSFASAVTAVGGQTYNETTLLTGQPQTTTTTVGGAKGISVHSVA